MRALAAFHETILAQPDADAPRLVFADWLEEQGEPCAELVRIQCALAAINYGNLARVPLQSRENELFSKYYDRWLGALNAQGFRCRFRRGLVEVSITGVGAFLKHAAGIFELPWVLTINLRDAAADTEQLEELTVSRHFSRLRVLDLSRSRIANRGMELLCRARDRCRLESLLLNNNNISSRGLQSLLSGIDITRLEELRLSTNGVGEQGVLSLARTPACANLRTLDLSYNQLGPNGGEHLAESRYLNRLRALYVRGNSISPRGKRALQRRFGPRVHIGRATIPF